MRTCYLDFCICNVCKEFVFDLIPSSLHFLHSFCLKGEALDGKSSAVIDYTPYLKFTQR